MKPVMLFAIIMITAIVIIAGFDLQLDLLPPIQLAPDVAANTLFVCPAADSMWDGIAQSMRLVNSYVVYGFFAAVLVLMFVWGWNLYQNLLEDKFKRTSFSKPWQFTKILFWAGVIALILAMTPNHFRRVEITGARGQWVLCEANSPTARPVKASAVHRH